MARPQPVVVRVTPDNLDAMLPLWIARHQEAGTNSATVNRAIKDGRLAKAVDRTDVAAWALFVDDTAIGYLLGVIRPLSALNDASVFAIEDIYVTPEHRRHGHTTHMLASVAACADRAGIEGIECVLPSQLRDTHRYLARLGFGAGMTRRVAAPAALIRRLRTTEATNADTVLEQRRRLVKNRASQLAHGLFGSVS